MNYLEKRKILFRWLKENGLFTHFLSYISDPQYYNMQIRIYHTANLNEILEKYSVYNKISHLLIWDKTKEGFFYWSDKNEAFNRYLKKLGIDE